ncbi:hypothetical protein NBRC116594_05010 [Shimia sp. NS0008-38b]
MAHFTHVAVSEGALGVLSGPFPKEYVKETATFLTRTLRFLAEFLGTSDALEDTF